METFEEMYISVVIPVLDCREGLAEVLQGLNEQTLLPEEVVIVDSSSNGSVQELIRGYRGRVPVVYHRERKAFPGKARNIGVGLAKREWVAFLDCKTVPSKDWLESYHYLVLAYNADVVFGVTRFDAQSSFQKLLRAATYGDIGHYTVPGTLLNKKTFNDSGGFLEHVRTAEDIEWRGRIGNKGLEVHLPEKPVIAYRGLSHSYLTTVKKYFISAFHTARVDVLKNMKDAYMSLLLILLALILPKWNHIIGGWDQNPLFIPHITKIYLTAIISVFFGYKVINYLLLRNNMRSIFFNTSKVLIFVFISFVVYKWNAVIAGWLEDSVFYIPHITKMYVGSIVVTSILYRGVVMPIKRKIAISYIFPMRWIKVGLLGLSLDIFKAPGYVFGAMVGFLFNSHLTVNSEQNSYNYL